MIEDGLLSNPRPVLSLTQLVLCNVQQVPPIMGASRVVFGDGSSDRWRGIIVACGDEHGPGR